MMKMSVKKIFFLSLFISFFSCFKFSAETFSFAASVGFQSGKVQEYVYDSGDVLSRLDWKTYFIPVADISSRLNIFHIVTDVDFLCALPIKYGTIEDWDWLGEDKTKATNFSKHDLSVERKFEVEAKSGYEFVFEKIKLVPQFGLRYRNQKFKAHDGYYKYADYENGEYLSSSIERKKINGTGLSYEQQFVLPFISLEAEYKIFSNWNLILNWRCYPYIYCFAVDRHYFRNTDFRDAMYGSGFLFGAELRYKSFSILANYEFLECQNGISEYKEDGKSAVKLYSVPGIKSSVASVMVRYRF